MAFARAQALRTLNTSLRFSGKRVLPRVSSPARTQLVARRCASGGGEGAHGHGEESSDLPWAIGAVVVTLPSCYYLWPDSSHAEAGHHRGHDEHEEGEGEEGEEKNQDEAPQEGSGESAEEAPQGESEGKEGESGEAGSQSEESEEKNQESEPTKASGDASDSLPPGGDDSQKSESKDDSQKSESQDDSQKSEDQDNSQKSEGQDDSQKSEGQDESQALDDRKHSTSSQAKKSKERSYTPSDPSTASGVGTDSEDTSNVAQAGDLEEAKRGGEGEGGATVQKGTRTLKKKPDYGQTVQAGESKSTQFGTGETKHSTPLDQDTTKSKKGEGAPETAKAKRPVDPERPAK
ncbi:hypothetical protein LTR37_009318 [Vermiconidia calcicola]|uniref:Uncharacterized protein n=1 Tax=Vermiconidia calcicola TaxID=1690605 RepID=A0ACC3N8P8_9PEZI|nr:hypothetical protein LTR37_009318 [Vermiconidia calcicola]